MLRLGYYAATHSQNETSTHGTDRSCNLLTPEFLRDSTL